MELDHDDYLILSKAVSLAPSNLIARERIALIEKSFSDNTRTLTSFLSSISFDGPSSVYSMSVIQQMERYGDQEILNQYLAVVAEDFDTDIPYQAQYKQNIEDFLEKTNF